MSRLQHSGQGKAICAFNAGFFGWGAQFRGMHVAPIVVDGKPLYNVPQDPSWWTFGVTRQGSSTAFALVQGATWKSIHSRYDTAIVHVRPLIVRGQVLRLLPGAGVTGLRCSRMSVAWTANSKRFYVLVVRDPDGEMSGVRQMKSGGHQTGGWDLREVQAFWKRLGVDCAIALDGGDSTQLAYLQPSGRYVIARSGYQASMTLGHLRGRPIRMFVPMLPPSQNHNGVMNYLYVTNQ